MSSPVRSSHYAHALEDRCVGNQAALLIKITVRLKMRRKVYSWGGARRCTICDNVTVRSASRRNKKTSGTFVGTVRQDPGPMVFERPWWEQPARSPLVLERECPHSELRVALWFMVSSGWIQAVKGQARKSGWNCRSCFVVGLRQLTNSEPRSAVRTLCGI
jgi:hypothetical protein